MAAGKSTVARALARRLRLAGRGHRRADRGARAAHRSPTSSRSTASRISAPPSARSSSCCCRCGTSSSRPAAARSWIPRTAPRSTWTACRSGSTCRSRSCSRGSRSTAGGRWPPTAPRWSGCSRCAWPPTARRQLRVDAGGAPGRGGGANHRMRFLILSDIHANVDAFDAVLDAAPREHVGPRARARRPGRLRRRAERRHRTRARARSAGGDPRQSRQGGLPPRRCQRLQSRRAGRRDVDRRDADPREPHVSRAAAGGPALDRRPRRDLPRRAVRRGPLHLRSSPMRRARSTPPRARSASSATRICRWSIAATAKGDAGFIPRSRER